MQIRSTSAKARQLRLGALAWALSGLIALLAAAGGDWQGAAAQGSVPTPPTQAPSATATQPSRPPSKPTATNTMVIIIPSPTATSTATATAVPSETPPPTDTSVPPSPTSTREPTDTPSPPPSPVPTPESPSEERGNPAWLAGLLAAVIIFGLLAVIIWRRRITAFEEEA